MAIGISKVLYYIKFIGTNSSDLIYFLTMPHSNGEPDVKGQKISKLDLKPSRK